jgi:hypothetical protein
MAGTAAELWEDFCEHLKRAGRVLDRETTPQDELTVAEGYRDLVRLVRLGFEVAVEFADTEHPQVYQSVTSTGSGEGETSDARYHQAFIDGAATYYVTGTRGSAPLIEFTVYAGKIGLQDVSRQVGALTEQDLILGPDGSFEIVLSPQPHSGNWIHTEREATMLFIRQYAPDWRKTRDATFEIRKGSATPHSRPLTLDQIRTGLRRTAMFVDKAAHFWAAVVDRYAAAEPNVFHEIPIAPDPSRPTMPAGHRFSFGYFRLAPGEAVLVTFTPADVPYWGLDLTNYWFEPLSYPDGDHQSHVNNQTATYESDGSVRIVIADEHRAAPNWLDTKGHREGTITFRWSRTQDPLPEITTKVVHLAAYDNSHAHCGH